MDLKKRNQTLRDAAGMGASTDGESEPSAVSKFLDSAKAGMKTVTDPKRGDGGMADAVEGAGSAIKRIGKKLGVMK
jgi:hypothetical protein